MLNTKDTIIDLSKVLRVHADVDDIFTFLYKGEYHVLGFGIYDGEYKGNMTNAKTITVTSIKYIVNFTEFLEELRRQPNLIEYPNKINPKKSVESLVTEHYRISKLKKILNR